MAHIAPSSNFNNTSGPNLDNNYGNKGKFTTEQQKERLKVHAIAITTGFPTYQQIVAQWKERFNIDIAIQSEKEWRKSNRLKIEKTRQALIESGDIEVPIVSIKVLADNLNVLIIDNCKIAKQIREKASKVLKKIDEEKMGAETEGKDLRLKVFVFSELMDAYDKANKGIVSSFDKMADLAGKAQMSDAKNSDEVPLLGGGTDEEEDSFNPTEVEISDADREGLK
jgi:hypothetical protein